MDILLQKWHKNLMWKLQGDLLLHYIQPHIYFLTVKEMAIYERFV